MHVACDGEDRAAQEVLLRCTAPSGEPIDAFRLLEGSSESRSKRGVGGVQEGLFEGGRLTAEASVAGVYRGGDMQMGE